MSLLPSFILLSCMVASNRKTANLNIFSSFSAMAKSPKSNVILENVQMSDPRGRTIISSINTLGESSVLSKASSIEYLTCIEA